MHSGQTQGENKVFTVARAFVEEQLLIADSSLTLWLGEMRCQLPMPPACLAIVGSVVSKDSSCKPVVLEQVDLCEHYVTLDDTLDHI